MRYKSRNNLTMETCEPLNWQVQHIYRDNTGPEIYTISLGGMAQMHSCIYYPEDKILSISLLMYSSDDPPLKFKVDTLEEASDIVNKFAVGMNYSTEDTIYTTGPMDTRHRMI